MRYKPLYNLECLDHAVNLYVPYCRIENSECNPEPNSTYSWFLGLNLPHPVISKSARLIHSSSPSSRTIPEMRVSVNG